MKVFLIILGVLLLIFILICSLKAEFTIIFDNGWTTKIGVLFIERDIKLTKLLSFLIAPEKAGKEAAEESKNKKKTKKEKSVADEGQIDKIPDKEAGEADQGEAQTEEAGEVTDPTAELKEIADKANITKKQESTKKDKKPAKPAKQNPIQKIIAEDGVVGILLLVSNLLQTVNTATVTLIKGLHIYSLYVKMIIGGGDAASIGEKFGSICGWYYPLKGVLLNQMKIDMYDDLIMPDFIAPRSEYEFQFIGSISVGLLLKVGLKAGKTFLVNYFKNK